MTTRTFTEKWVRDEAGYIAKTDLDTLAIQNCHAEMLDWTGLHKGAVVIFETVETTLVTEMKPEWRYGFNGQLHERQVSRTTKALCSKTCKLRSKKGELYWSEVPDATA